MANAAVCLCVETKTVQVLTIYDSTTKDHLQFSSHFTLTVHTPRAIASNSGPPEKMLSQYQ